MTIKNICFILACLLTTAMSAFEFKNAVIYCPKNAPPSVRKAANELQKHLEPVIGKRLAIVRKPQKNMIALGNSASSRKAGIDVSTFADEEYRILTKGQDLFITGKDLRNDAPTKYGSKAGGRSYGTLYAVYDFLEHQIGVSHLMPGAKGIWYPPKNPDLKIKSLDIRYKPRFITRQIIWYLYMVSAPVKDNSIADFLSFNRFDHNRVAGSAYWLDQHSWPHLYPKKNSRHMNVNVLKSREDTFKEHPEYFQLSQDGKRIPPVGRVSLCISNPDVSKDVAGRIRILADRSKHKHPLLFMAPSDGTPICYCKNCQQQTEMLDHNVVGPTGEHFLKQSWSKLMMDYYRRVAEQVPDVLLRCLIYQRYEFLPHGGVAKMPDNIVAGMAPLQTGYGPIRLYSPINEAWKRWEKSWRGVFKQKIYQSLEFWMSQYAGAPMSPYPAMLKDTFDAVNADPAYVGFYVFLNAGLGHSSLFNWMILQLMWNPGQDPYKLMDQYLTKAYGQGAPKIREIYQLVEKNMTRYMTARKGKSGYNISPEMLIEVYAANWADLERLYLEAEKCSMDENQKWRLAMLGENLKLLRYHLVKYNLIQDKPSPLRMTSEEFQTFNKRRNPGGDLFLYVNSPYLTRHMKGAAQRLTSVKLVDPKEFKNREKVQYNTFYRYHQDFIVYADKSGKAEFEIETESDINPATGKEYLPDISYFTVLDKNGKMHWHDITSNGKIAFNVQKGNYYYLFYSSQLGTTIAYPRWRLKSANMPFAVGTRIKPNSGLMCWSFKDPLYFRVKDKTPEFKLYFSGVNADVELIGPDGKKYNSSTKAKTFQFNVKKPIPGWWKLRFTHPKGFRGTIHCSDELNGYFVQDPDKALDIELGKGSIL